MEESATTRHSAQLKLCINLGYLHTSAHIALYPSKTPLKKAHAWSGLAEDYYHRGKYHQAAQAYSKAARLFQQALQDIRDVETVEALRLLHIHTQERAAQMQEDTRYIKKQAMEINRQQQMTPMGSSTQGPSITTDHPTGVEHTQHATPTKDSDQPTMGNNDDPFEAFWVYLESLVDKMSNPVAFTTAPVGTTGSSSSPIPARTPASIAESFYVVPEQTEPLSDLTSGFTPTTPTTEAVPWSPSNSEAESQTTNDEVQALRQTVHKLRKEVAMLQRAANENTALRSSILTIRQEVQKKARDLKQTTGDSSRSGVRSIQALPTRTLSHDLCERRIAELEAQLKQAKVVIHQKDELLAKYKTRWEKLKESAKKKRDSKRDLPNQG
ncbi:hypothetical protein IWQ62_004828 [Dispira parvispora]|uniref:Uncharacterized protein n=1 Tax=Dispira parvispora TaxID=1520584 RepID=A0A9W8E594_9FUNG|nr:hypothetical protein IWQ62_004828 [Dispira parvispora]